jgi:hypothetical protein
VRKSVYTNNFWNFHFKRKRKNFKFLFKIQSQQDRIFVKKNFLRQSEISRRRLDLVLNHIGQVVFWFQPNNSFTKLRRSLTQKLNPTNWFGNITNFLTIPNSNSKVLTRNSSITKFLLNSTNKSLSDLEAVTKVLLNITNKILPDLEAVTLSRKLNTTC